MVGTKDGIIVLVNTSHPSKFIDDKGKLLFAPDLGFGNNLFDERNNFQHKYGKKDLVMAVESYINVGDFYLRTFEYGGHYEMGRLTKEDKHIVNTSKSFLKVVATSNTLNGYVSQIPYDVCRECVKDYPKVKPTKVNVQFLGDKPLLEGNKLQFEIVKEKKMRESETQPITPQEVREQNLIPGVIMSVINQLITDNWDGKQSKVNQDDIVSKIVECSHLKRNEIFEKNYLDIEDNYKSAGWKVEYNSPDRDQSFKEYFIFKPKK